MTEKPFILRPFQRSEAIPIAEAARIAGCAIRTMRERCQRYDLGRKIGGQWLVSKVALCMWLDGNREALAAYLAGDRKSSIVTEYFDRCGLPLQRRDNGFRERLLSEVKTPSPRVGG